MSKIAIRNARVVATFNDDMTELQDADIFIEGPAIARVGCGLDVASFKPDEVIDASDYLVMPGLVNTHHHFYQTLTRCVPRVQASPLFDWLTNLYEIWRELDQDAVYWSSLLALSELIRTGCTTANDQHYVFPSRTSGELIDMQIKAAAEMGIRLHPCRGSMSRGKSQGGLPPDDVVQTEDTILADCQRLIEAYHDPEPLSMCRIVLSPCSPFSVTEDLLRQTVELAASYENVYCHTHVAETKDEDTYCAEIYEKRPVDFMESVGWTTSNIWYAHCVYVNSEEIQRFAGQGIGVAHCPSSNMLLGSGNAPIPEMMQAGVKVGLAVDGSASNDSSNMLLEARQCMLLHRLKHGADAMSARQALWLATRGGASVLGRDDIGSLEPGKAADLVMIDLTRPDYAGALSDPLAAVVYCGDSFVVDKSIINGKLVLDQGHIVNLDETVIAEKANAISRAMIKNASNRTGIDFLSPPN